MTPHTHTGSKEEIINLCSLRYDILTKAASNPSHQIQTVLQKYCLKFLIKLHNLEADTSH